MQQVFTDWQPSHNDMFGEQVLELGHNLAASGLFSDDVLADLIERTPREDYHVSTMDPESHDPRSRREGVIEGLSGHQVLDAVRNGHIWLNLRNSAAYNRGYDAMLDKIYGELAQRMGLKTFKQEMTILISSPKVHVGYHCDVPGQTLWQLRGTKRVYLYPNVSPFLPQSDLFLLRHLRPMSMAAWAARVVFRKHGCDVPSHRCQRIWDVALRPQWGCLWV